MNYTEDFNRLWQQYPKRCGGNPKPRAFKAFTARLKEKVLYSELQAGLLRYYNYCKQTGILRTSYVMQAATFFSANTESWCEDWELPKEKQEWEKIPSDNEKLWDWAKKWNFSGPGSLTYYQYRGVLQTEVERRALHERN